MKNRSRITFLTAYSKLLLLSLIILLWAFAASMRVHANEAVPLTVSANEVTLSDTVDTASRTDSAAVYTVINIENSDLLYNLEPFEMVRRSSQNTEPLFYHIFNNNLLNVTAVIEDSAGTITTRTLSVSWSCWDDSTTVTDTTVCGEYIETGSIQLPDDSYAWGEGVFSELTLLVRVYDPQEPVEIVSLEEVWNEFDTAFSLEQNGSIEDLLENENNSISLQTAWSCYDANGNEYLCPVIYNTEAVKEDTVGIYDISVTFEAPLNCRFSDALTVPSYSIPVTVQAPGHPRLDVSYISPNYDFIIFPWISSGINLDTMEVWMSENDGEWRMLELDWEAYIYDAMLNLYAFLLTEGSSYQIQVKYEGGQTGIASFTYEWDMLSGKEYIDGDRDGGDTNGNPPKDSDENISESENTDNNPSKPSTEDANTENTLPENSTKYEDSSTETENNSTDISSGTVTSNPETVETLPPSLATTTLPKETSDNHKSIPDDMGKEPAVKTPVPSDTLSDREKPYLFGSEITLMLENLGSARFSEETIMLDIPADAITSLGIGDTDQLLVTILPLQNNGFSIDILKNDIAITTLSSMQVSLPYQPAPNTTPVLMNEYDEKVSSGEYRPDTGIVTFTINETGIFYIQDEAVPMQDSFNDNTLTEAEITAPEKGNDNSGFKMIATVVTVTTTGSAAGAAIYVYNIKRRL